MVVAFPEFFTRLARKGSMEDGNGVRWDVSNAAFISPGGRGWMNISSRQSEKSTVDGLSNMHEKIMPYKKDIVKTLHSYSDN